MKKLSLLLITLITIAACKKNDTTTSAQTPTTTTPAYTVDAQGLPSGTYNGCLSYTADSLSSGIALTEINCSFSNPAAPYINMSGNSIVNAVSANGINVHKEVTGNNTAVYSLDTAYVMPLPPCQWQVNGNSVIPTFSYTSSTPLPSISSVINQLPSTISTQQDFSVSLHGASNYDAVFMEITNFSFTTQMSVPSTNSTIVIPKDSLAKLPPNTNYRIAMAFIKYDAQTINGKKFIFCAQRNFHKVNVSVN